MVLVQKFSDGKTQYIDIGNNFVIITPVSNEWVVNEVNMSKDAHMMLSYCDYNGNCQYEPLYNDFKQWIYSNNGQLFMNLTFKGIAG